eukprot:COSAG05_NODE_3438_length_2063_cov_2.613035_1_plen_214_part_00
MKLRKRVWHAIAAEGQSTGQGQQDEGGGEGSEATVQPSRFATELWDSFAKVHADVKAQTQACASLSRYMQARLQLDRDYYRRLSSLNELLPQPSNDSVLLRPYGPIFEVLTSAAGAAARLQSSRCADMEQGGLPKLSALVQRHAAELERLSSEAARLRLHLKQAYANLERDHTEYIRRQHAAMASASISSGNPNASQALETPLVQASARAEAT